MQRDQRGQRPSTLPLERIQSLVSRAKREYMQMHPKVSAFYLGNVIFLSIRKRARLSRDVSR